MGSKITSINEKRNKRENPNKLLVNGHQHCFNKELALALGCEREAYILQRIYYWTQVAKEKGNNYFNGYYWTYNTLEDWQKKDFPFLHLSTIRRKLKSLEEKGLLVKGNFNKKGYDRTSWYRVNEKEVDKLLKAQEEKNEEKEVKTTSVQNEHMDLLKRDRPIPNYSSNNSNNQGTGMPLGVAPIDQPISFDEFKKRKNDEYLRLKEREIKTIDYFLEKYEQYRKEKHPPLKETTWDDNIEKLFLATDEFGDLFDIQFEEMIEIVEQYFRTPFENGCNYRLGHFNSPKQKGNRYYELYS